ncbi:MAG: serine/threonine protein kinase [Bryobacterales bacterium]|nr:serine/threonine protein kinase [Bryobacterales bacterium]
MATDPRWLRIQDLFDALAASSPWEWKSRLAKMEPDPELRAEVLSLLDASGAEQQASLRSLAPAPILPDAIGPYRILGLAGAGGCGRVYQATREVAGIRQTVAIKTMLDHLIAPSDLARFEREQRHLLSLQHPSIARFIESAWDENQRPYLVMEWIEGDAIDEFIRKRDLPFHARVRLVIELLDALQDAHRNLIVHLDLKPSNIKVTPEGRVRILDFGTAKLMSDGSSTATLQLTPRYASPEQLRAEPVTTSCDIYSSAVLLHEIVTGRLPFRHSASLASLGERASGAALLDIATGHDDLDAILHKALQHTPLARYATAVAFAADLDAFLNRRPVSARRPTVSYVVVRLVARHRAAFALSSLAFIALVTLGVYAIGQQQLREKEASRARDIGRFLVSMIRTSTINAAGRNNVTVAEMVERGNQRIQAGSFLPDSTAAMLQSSFASFFQELGREDLAESIARDAIARADRGIATAPRVAARAGLAALLMRIGRCADSLQILQHADTIVRNSSEAPPVGKYLDFRFQQAESMNRCENRPANAIAKMEEIIREADSLPADAFDIAAPVYCAGLRISLTLYLAQAGRHQDALRAASEGIRIAANHPDGRYVRIALLRTRSNVHSIMGASAAGVADIQEAARLAPGAVNPFEELRLQTLLAGRTYDNGNPEAALRIAKAAITMAGPRRAEIGPSYWMLLAEAAEVHAKAMACPESAAFYREADSASPGPFPNTWLGNRRYYEAECALPKNPVRAAELAQQSLDAYGSILPQNSQRRARLGQIASKRK